MLTLRQRKTYDFIQHFIEQHSYAPTTTEIAEGIGIKSRGVVHRYLKALQQEALIRLTPKKHRNIVLLKKKSGNLPLLGTIAAGTPLEAIEQQETLDITSLLLGEDRYALRVKGESMIDDGIFDGDIVICRRSSAAESGQIVVALVNNGEATLKRLFHNPDNNTITLTPSNQTLEPMVFSHDAVTVQGIYVGLLRVS